MKQHSWLVFGIVLLVLQLCQSVTVVTAARTLGLGKSCRLPQNGITPRRSCRKGLFCNATTQRCARLGSLGAPCKLASTDCKLVKDGAVCFQQQCFGNTARPKLAPCKQDTHCATGYCGTESRCALQHAEGAFCRRPQHCTSGKCDALTAKCLAADITTTTTTTTSTTPSASSTPALVLAKAARAAATPNANSRAFTSSSSSPNSRALLQRPGQVDTLGNVNVAPTSAGAAIRMLADSLHPAVVQQVLDTPLKTAGSSGAKPITLTFHYLVTALQDKANGGGGDGQCIIVPFVNDVQLTPSSQAINANAQSGTATFTYTDAAPVTSYAVSVVCEAVASTTMTTVEIDTVAIAATPPTCATNMSNCDFESGTISDVTDWTTIADGQSTGAITSNAADVRTGMYAYQCTVTTKGDRCGLRRSVSAASLSTSAAKYDYTFWAKSASSSSFTCVIATSTVTYFNNVADQVASGGNNDDDNNGFRQYAATFILSDNMKGKVDLQCFTTDVGTYAFDDFGLTQNTAVVPSDVLPAGKCRGLDNCGFEDIKDEGALTVIDANDNTDDRAQCTTTSNDEFVRSGQSAELCTITAVASDKAFIYLEGGNLPTTYTAGASYVWTFWVQLSNGASAQSLTCVVWADDGDGAVAFKGTCPLTTAKAVNGFRQVAVAFVAPSTQMSVFIAMKDVGRCAFDDVSMLEDDNGAMAMAIQYDPATTPLGSTTSDLTFTQACTGGLSNCDFETGYANGYALQFGPLSSCVITSDTQNVHAGLHALQCDTTTDLSTPLQITPKTSQAGLLAGLQYTFSFWCKTTAASGANSISAMLDGVQKPMPAMNGGVADANGFVQYAVTFTASKDTDQPSVAVKLTTPDVYYIDTFSLAITPLPSTPLADCTYLPNCGFEDIKVNPMASYQYFPLHFISSGDSWNSPLKASVNRPDLTLDGQYSEWGALGGGFPTYLQSNAASGSGTAYVVGAAYVWTFWISTTNNDFSTFDFTCVVWERNGLGAVAYQGSCPLTTAPAVQGYRQVAIPFIASHTQMDVMVVAKSLVYEEGRLRLVAMDDFSILAGKFAFQYDVPAGSTTPPLTVGSGKAAPVETCSGFMNCGFENGLTNGHRYSYYGNGHPVACSITSDPANVYDGKFALQCNTPDQSNYPGFFDIIPIATTDNLYPDPYLEYTVTFWMKLASGDQPNAKGRIFGIRTSDNNQVNFYNQPYNIVTPRSDATNGFTQFSATFVITEATVQLSAEIYTQYLNSVLYFDKIDLTSRRTNDNTR